MHLPNNHFFLIRLFSLDIYGFAVTGFSWADKSLDPTNSPPYLFSLKEVIPLSHIRPSISVNDKKVHFPHLLLSMMLKVHAHPPPPIIYMDA